MKKLISMLMLFSGLFVPQNIPAVGPLVFAPFMVAAGCWSLWRGIKVENLDETTRKELLQLTSLSENFQAKFEEKGFLEVAEKKECFTKVARSLASSMDKIEDNLAQLRQPYCYGTLDSLDENDLISELRNAQEEILHFRNRLEESPLEVSDEDATKQFNLMLKLNECIMLLNNTSRASASYAALPKLVEHGGFAGETLVKLPNGGYATIAELKVGDNIICSDRDGHECIRPILSKAYQKNQPVYRYEIVHPGDRNVLGYFLSNRTDFTEFAITNCYDQGLVVSKGELAGTRWVYLLEVAEHHNFFITKHNLLVHNGSWSRALYMTGGVCALAGGVCLAVAAAPVTAATATSCAIWGAGLGAAGGGTALLANIVETQEEKHTVKCRDAKANGEPKPYFCSIQ